MPMPIQEKTVLKRISKDIDEIRAEVFSHVESVQDAFADRGFLPIRLNLNKGVVRGILELFCWGYFQIYILLQRLLQQVAPATSTGEWLDLHADSVNLVRRTATKARGNVRFCRANGVSIDDNITIAVGRIVRTLPDGTGEIYRYSTIAPAVLQGGCDYVDVLVEAEEYGAASNATVAQICELVTPVTGIGRVTNVSDWLLEEGANEETDSQLAERYALQWQGNNGCTKYAYMGWALSVPGVTSVSILDRHPRGQGTVDIVVRGADVLPTEALLDKVRAAIAPNVPINDDWIVKGPEAVPVSLIANIEYVTGSSDIILSQAENRIRALFAETSPLGDVTALAIGQDLMLDLLTHTVMAISGVKSVTWSSPTADIIIGASQVARLNFLQLTATAALEA